MTATLKNLTADRGTTFTLSVKYKDSTGTPVDLTGWTATFALYEPGREGTTPLFDYQATVTNDGWIQVKVADEDTATWSLGKNAYRLMVETPDGDKTALLYGPVVVRSLTNV